VVLANSDLIDTLGVVVFPSISVPAPIVRSLSRGFRFCRSRKLDLKALGRRTDRFFDSAHIACTILTRS
jgi:hypothetical protein